MAGSAVAFSQKPKAEKFSAPPVDETPIPREIGGHSSFSPVVKKVAPGVVKVFTSTDWQSWSEQSVDYRATAERVMLAGVGEDVWLVTDGGMILKSTETP